MAAVTFTPSSAPPALLQCEPGLFAVEMSSVETNILRFRLPDAGLTPPEFCARMGRVCEGEEAALGRALRVLMCPQFGNSVRAVWHLGVSSEDTELAVRKMEFVASQYLKEKLQ